MPSTRPAILGRLKAISNVTSVLTSTIRYISSRVALSGVRGSGSRPASQATIHSPGTTKRASDRLGEGKSRNGDASASSTHCHRSQKMAVCRRAIVTRFKLRLPKRYESHRHCRQVPLRRFVSLLPFLPPLGSHLLSIRQMNKTHLGSKARPQKILSSPNVAKRL